MKKAKAEDLAVTTTYIYSYCIGENPAFFMEIDKCIKLAKKFIKKYPTGTNWEKQKNTWDETIYNFVKKNRK